MQVKYIGTCNKVDSIEGVGLMWVPGQERDVTSTVAAHLLAYVDTWVKGEEESDKKVSTQKETKVEAADKPEPIDFLEKDKHKDEPIAIINFHAMSKEALRDYASKQWNENFPKNWGEDVIRERVTKRHTREEMDSKEGR